MYRLDLSDAMVATAGTTKIYLQGATNMAPTVVEIEVVAVNKYDGVRGGMTALPNAAADAAGGLPISDAGALDIDTLLARLDAAISTRYAGGNITGNLSGSVGSVTGAVGSVTGAVGSVTAPVTVGTNSDKTGYALSAGGVTAVQSGLSTLAVADIRTLVGLAADNLIDELTGAPGARPTLAGAVMRLYMESANNTTMTALLKTIRNNAGASIITQAVSDDGTTAAHAKDA